MVITYTQGMRFGFAGWLGCVAAGVAVYILVWTALMLCVSPIIHIGFGHTPLGVRARHAFAMASGMAIFLELYWWTRPFVFSGHPATSPERLFSMLLMVVASWSMGTLVARVFASRQSPFRFVYEMAAWVFLVIGLGFLMFGPTGPGTRGEVNSRTQGMPNVLLVVVDALRADVIGAYGNERVQTPVMDGLANSGVIFENAQVQAPYTWTSFGSILTGKYPRRHGLMKMKPGVVMAANVTLAWHLKNALVQSGIQSGDETRLTPDDYATGTFMTGTLSQGSGLMRGFDVYFEALAGHELVDNERAWSVYRSDLLYSLFKNKITQRFDSGLVVTTARDWLREHEGRRFLSMVHLYSTHTPYDPDKRFRDMYVDSDYDGPVTSFYAEHREAMEAWDKGETDEHGNRIGYGVTEADKQQIRDLYYGGVTQADAAIGEVLNELRATGALENTLVIVTADHGEELGDHGVWEHNWMFESNLRVPLIMSWERGLEKGVRVNALVESIDIVPTICELLGVELPQDDSDYKRGIIDGRSLMPLIRATVAQDTEVTESWSRYSFAENGRFLSIRDEDWKLIVQREGLALADFALDSSGGEGARERPRLFHLAEDPGEFNDLWATPKLQEQNQAQCKRLLTDLTTWASSMPIPISFVVKSPRDFEDAKVMAGLGYTGMLEEYAEEERAAKEKAKLDDEGNE
ncbi:MAG: sulfatase-like hydrolase/transferase [Planctomycetota bacterium]|nr:sulfatase-like hydrolase/transferase [Planctomycetota bacterium]